MSYTHRLLVRFAECDPQGIVFFANYLLYADVAFTEFWRDTVGPWSEMNDAGYDAVVANVELAFSQPARFDEEIDIEWEVTRLGRASIESTATYRRGDTLLVTLQIRHVVVSKETWTSTEMPAFIRDALTA